MKGHTPKYSASQVPSVPELIAFEAIARYKNFSKAADELSVTQSAISHRIQQLEARLGTTLFHRQTSQTELTEAGEVFLPKVQEILSALENAISVLQAKAVKRVRLAFLLCLVAGAGFEPTTLVMSIFSFSDHRR